jgi:hypothetical protein
LAHRSCAAAPEAQDWLAAIENGTPVFKDMKHGRQRLPGVEVRDERDGALVVELAEHVVEQQHRRAPCELAREPVATEAEREGERPPAPGSGNGRLRCGTDRSQVA